jgi:hypothetical protein
VSPRPVKAVVWCPWVARGIERSRPPWSCCYGTRDLTEEQRVRPNKPNPAKAAAQVIPAKMCPHCGGSLDGVKL